MEFQNEPFQDLKTRVETLETVVAFAVDQLEARIKALEEAGRDVVDLSKHSYVKVGASEPEKVRKEQDDA